MAKQKFRYEVTDNFFPQIFTGEIESTDQKTAYKELAEFYAQELDTNEKSLSIKIGLIQNKKEGMETMTTNKNFTLSEMKEAQESKELHWFEKGAMRFFNTRIVESTVEQNHFITSEKFDENTPRKYSIRKFDPVTFQVDTIGEFQQYETLGKAKTALKNLLN